MEKSGGFDIAKMTMASKIVMVSGILLLVDSFLSWQKVCASDIWASLGGRTTSAPRRTPGVGAAAFAGLIMGILLIILLIWEGIQLANAPVNLSIGVTPSQGTAYLGFAVVVFGLLKFILVVHERAVVRSVDRIRPAAGDRRTAPG